MHHQTTISAIAALLCTLKSDLMGSCSGRPAIELGGVSGYGNPQSRMKTFSIRTRGGPEADRFNWDQRLRVSGPQAYHFSPPIFPLTKFLLAMGRSLENRCFEMLGIAFSPLWLSVFDEQCVPLEQVREPNQY